MLPMNKGEVDFMKNRAFVMIIIAGILWGTSSFFVQFLTPFGFWPFHMTFFRAFVALISLAIYILIRDKQLFKVTLKELLLFAGSGLAFFGTASCYYISMQATSVSTAVVLMYITPVLVMIYSVIFFGEKLTLLKIISVFLMLLGCCLVSGVVGGLKFDLWGIIVGVMSGILYASYNIITKMQMRNGSNPFSATFYCFTFAAVIAFWVCKPASIPQIISTNPPAILLLLLSLGICTCVLPYFLYTFSLKTLPAGTASALGIIEPMSATVFSVVLFNEKLGITSAYGIILILGAVFLLSKNKEM